jgi:hypothetical protein
MSWTTIRFKIMEAIDCLISAANLSTIHSGEQKSSINQLVEPLKKLDVSSLTVVSFGKPEELPIEANESTVVLASDQAIVKVDVEDISGVAKLENAPGDGVHYGNPYLSFEESKVKS